MFAGGFDLESACAVPGSNDDFTILDLLDALVRKSLLAADRSSVRTRFSMLETIRQFAEEQLAARGEAIEARAAHARYFAGRETDLMALWDSPRQREAYDWFATELANLRSAFRWAADQSDLDTAAAIATQAGFFGLMVENLEPVTWAEELVEPARTLDHLRLVSLCGLASLCFMLGRVDEALAYSNTGQIAMRPRPDEGGSASENFGLGLYTVPSASPNGMSRFTAIICPAVTTPTNSGGQPSSSRSHGAVASRRRCPLRPA